MDFRMSPTDPTKLVISNFDFSMTSSLQEDVLQRLQIRLRRFLGEWYLDTTAGVPYFQEILKKNPNRFLVESYLKQVILGTKGVSRLTTFVLDYDNPTRKITLNFSVSLSDGSTITGITI